MGTAGLLGMLSQYDELIHCNFRDTSHVAAEIERIGGEALASHPAIRVRRRACFQCPIGCTRDTELLDTRGVVVDRGEGPEFETVAMFGANLAVYDLEPITEANYLCNRLGLDTIAAGGTIAALMEIFEIARATRPEARTDGERALMADVAAFAQACGEDAPGGDGEGRFAPAFGNATALVPLVRAMGRGEGGLGRALASGSRRLAERYGHPEAAMAVKGMEIPAYDPRVTWTQAMSYMTAARGGCHLQGGYSAPIAFCAGYGEFPGHEVRRRGAGGAQLRLPEHGVRRARRVRLRRVLGHARRVREHAERRDRARDEGERSRNGLAPGADARAPLQPALRIHGGRRLAARALLPRTDRRRGGERRLPRR